MQGLVAGAEQKAGRGRSVQEKRTCPECGQQVGPRFGTGKGGEGSQCPGLNPSGTRCHYVFGEGQKKQVQKRLVEQCSQKPHGPLSEVKAAYAKAYKKVSIPQGVCCCAVGVIDGEAVAMHP